MPTTITTHLMFDGDAEEAVRLYVSLLPESRIDHLERYGPGDASEGKVKMATVTLAGQTFICIDTPVQHEFTFTPAMSLFVECEHEEQQALLFDRLSEGGSVFIPLDEYDFSRRFGWVQDRFGVSWQLNLA